MRRIPLVPVLVLVAGLAALSGSAWRAARAPGRAQPVSDAARKAVSEAVYGYVKLVAHLHGSGGDRRFAERLPAGPEVVGEALADVQFATHAGNIEEPRLIRAELRDVRPAGFETYDVELKEFWVTRTIAAAGDVLGTRSDVVIARYRVQRGPGGWRVVAWDLVTTAGDA